MTPEAFLKAATYASAQSDRWLFLVTLGLMMIGGIVIIRYLVKQNEEQRAAHAKDQQQERESRERQQQEQAKSQEKLVLVLHDSTEVMKEMRAFLERGKHLAVLLVASCWLLVSGCAALEGTQITAARRIGDGKAYLSVAGSAAFIGYSLGGRPVLPALKGLHK